MTVRDAVRAFVAGKMGVVLYDVLEEVERVAGNRAESTVRNALREAGFVQDGVFAPLDSPVFMRS